MVHPPLASGGLRTGSPKTGLPVLYQSSWGCLVTMEYCRAPFRISMRGSGGSQPGKGPPRVHFSRSV